ncbi:SGNH hydrolase domain-containing protein [Cupriavidus basilensis]|uniref:SGNH hydrolase domain-containing protein n=1 Tax=Cupriavidus basilensis TaxID=68895 RepID=UPI003D3374EB
MEFYSKDLRASYEQTGHTVIQGKRADACWNKVELTDPSTCRLGRTAASPTAIYWGDSHAYHLAPFIDQLGKEFGLSIHDVTLSMCPPIEQGPARAGNPAFQTHSEECLRHNEAVFSYLLAHPEIVQVIMAAVWQGYVGVQVPRHPIPMVLARRYVLPGHPCQAACSGEARGAA